MANPRRKHSKSRTRKRRSVYYGSLSSLPSLECKECGNRKLYHRVCMSCGLYRGRQMLDRAVEV